MKTTLLNYDDQIDHQSYERGENIIFYEKKSRNNNFEEGEENPGNHFGRENEE